jgi:hypothetical protein
MNSIDTTRKEKEILLNLSLKLANDSKDGMASPKKERENSYYQQSSRNPDEYIRTYAFDTIAELRMQLVDLWQNEESMHGFIPVVLASTFKERPAVDEDHKTAFTHKDGDDNEEILPTYTYTM